MTVTSSDAALERRRQQNRDAQRKRRNNLKAQIEELQARNSELEALKEAAFSGNANQSALPTRRNGLLTPDPSCGSLDSSNMSTYEPSVLLNWDEGALGTPVSATSQADFPTLDDDAFMRDLCINWKSNNIINESEGHLSNPRCLSREAEDTPAALDKSIPVSIFGSEPVSGPETCQNEAAESLSPRYMSVATRIPLTTPTPTQTKAAGITLADLANDDSDSASSLDRRASVVSASRRMEVRRSMSSIGVGTKGRVVTPDTSRRGSRHDGKQAAMVLAVANRQAAVVPLLLKHGADVNARDEKGRTVLHDTAEKNDADMMHLLLDHGADASIVDKSGMTPIEIAAFLGNIEALEVLLTATADHERLKQTTNQ